MVESRKRQSKSLTLEQAISLLQEAGFSIEAPPLAETAQKLQEVPAKLGFVTAVKPVKAKMNTAKLVFCHSVNGRVFGPGEVQVKSLALLHHLLNKDAMAIAQENNTFNPVTNSYIIVNRRTPDGHQGPAKVPVGAVDLSHIENLPIFDEIR